MSEGLLVNAHLQIVHKVVMLLYGEVIAVVLIVLQNAKKESTVTQEFEGLGFKSKNK